MPHGGITNSLFEPRKLIHKCYLGARCGGQSSTADVARMIRAHAVCISWSSRLSPRPAYNRLRIKNRQEAYGERVEKFSELGSGDANVVSILRGILKF